VDSLSNPLIIVAICVPKRSEKIICVDYQMFMFFVPKVDGVENEESMWKGVCHKSMAHPFRFFSFSQIRN